MNWEKNLNSQRFITDFIILLNDMIMIWKSCKQFTIILSIIKVEYMILMNIIKEIKWIHQLFDELNYDIIPHSLIILKINNQGILALTKNPVNHSRSKYINIKHHFIHKTITKEIVWLEYITSENMTADFLMKSLKYI